MIDAFGATSTADDVLSGVDLGGRRVLVTGVSSGLGLETARTLAAHGASVVGTVRDLARAQAAARSVHDAAKGGGGLELVELDLGSLASVRACANALVQAGAPFDVVIANAGVMMMPRSTTADGFEADFGVNHLGHFVLVNRVADLIRPGGRLVNLTAGGHRHSDIDLEDLNSERVPFSVTDFYGRSKTANMLFTVEFDARHKAQGVRATAANAGHVETDLTRHMGEQLRARMVKNRPPGASIFRSVPQGAATIVWAGLVAPADRVAARFCENCQAAEVNDDPAIRRGVRSYAVDPDRARALWARSEEMVGERF